MEIHFQQTQQQQHRKTGTPISQTSKFKGRNRSKSNNKLIGVRQRPSGRWVAEIKDTTQKIRMWLGTFETAEEAGRAYDEAACLLRGSNTRTNFKTHVSLDSPIASRIQNLLKNNKKGTKQARVDDNIFRPTGTSSSGSSNSNKTSNGGISGENPVSIEKTDQEHEIFGDVCRPDLSNCTEEFETGSSQYDLSWCFGSDFDKFTFTQAMMDMPNNIGFPSTNDDDSEFPEFERMKVERQMSASLYAINGVHEIMETGQDPSDALLWDLPLLCSLLS